MEDKREVLRSICHNAKVYPWSSLLIGRDNHLTIVNQWRCIKCGEICEVKKIKGDNDALYY